MLATPSRLGNQAPAEGELADEGCDEDGRYQRHPKNQQVNQQLPRTKLSIACIAQTRHNEANIVQMRVDLGGMDRNIRMCFL